MQRSAVQGMSMDRPRPMAIGSNPTVGPRLVSVAAASSLAEIAHASRSAMMRGEPR